MTSLVSSTAAQSATLSLSEIPDTVRDRLAEVVAPLPVHELAPAKKLRATARSVKVNLVLDPTPFVGLTLSDNHPRYMLPVDVAGRVIRADLARKAIRKAARIVAELGPEGVVLLLAGNLEADNTLASAGLSVMPKNPKPKADAPAEAVV